MGRPIERYEKRILFRHVFTVGGDSSKNGGVLLYEAFGDYGPEQTIYILMDLRGSS